MEKLLFEFTLLPGSDGKSNILCITSITTCDNKVYAIPAELQSVCHHKQIMKTSAHSKVKNSLVKRYQIRRLWVSMSEELAKTYMDEDDNIQFMDQYLEEIEKTQPSTTSQIETDSLQDLFKKLEHNAPVDKNQSLKDIADRFVIEKFTSKNMNAGQWIQIFEECARFDITTDNEKIALLRLFMDRSCADWYSSMIIKLTMDSEWSSWRSKFCESFTNKGWNLVTYALSFKYKEGTLLDYAIRKEKLLLEMRRSIDIDTLIDLIAVGLPENILNKIDRQILKDTVDLFNEISKYEHMVYKKRFVPKSKFGNLKTNIKNEDQTPCKICTKLNKGIRYHAESICWFKSTEDDKIKKNFIKHVNNAVIEAELNETNQKNE